VPHISPAFGEVWEVNCNSSLCVDALNWRDTKSNCFRSYNRFDSPDRMVANYLASASRFSFAQAPSRGTAFRGGPPFVPQAHGPSVLASVMQEQDFVFRQAQT